MRKIILRQSRDIAPFNEPASQLRILNKPLFQWQRDLLAPYTTEEMMISAFREAPRDHAETLVVAENLWFDEPFLEYFLTESRRRGTATRAAFHREDEAYLQQGLAALTRSYEPISDLYGMDLWYFPDGVTSQTEAIVVPSEAREVGYHHIPTNMGGASDDLVWLLPKRSVCPIDTWVHVFFANIVFGIFAQASRIETRSASDTVFRLRATARAIVERTGPVSSSLYIQQGQNCSIDPSTVFQGPVIIGDNVTIGPGCVISQCIIGDNVTLTHGNHFHMSVLSDNCFFPWGASGYFTTFMEDASAAANAALEMCVVGRDSYIGGGTVFANFNLLPTPMHAEVDADVMEIDMPVLGGCVGHNCRIGPGLVIYPGRMIESDVILVASPTRRVIMQNISYEESDHHATPTGHLHPRKYPRTESSTEADW